MDAKTHSPGQTLSERIEQTAQFKSLLAAKARFIVPATVFFVVYYLALPVMAGYARPFMQTQVIGPVNIAYLFALSQFFMAWILAWLYVRKANRFDEQARQILAALRVSEDTREGK